MIHERILLHKIIIYLSACSAYFVDYLKSKMYVDTHMYGDTCTLFKEVNSRRRFLVQTTSESFRPRANWHQLRSAYLKR